MYYKPRKEKEERFKQHFLEEESFFLEKLKSQTWVLLNFTSFFNT